MADALGRVTVTSARPTIVSVDPADQAVVTVTQNQTVVGVAAAGPKETVGTLGSLEDLDVGNKVDKSVVYYDGNSDTFKADSLYTVFTLTDGGNF